MTSYEKIIEAMSPFNLPHAPDLYTGKAKRYYTYNYSDDRGLGFGDDGCDLSVAYLQLHVWLPVSENYLSMKTSVRRKLVAQGFTWPTVTILQDETNRMNHIIFEMEIEEAV